MHGHELGASVRALTVIALVLMHALAGSTALAAAEESAAEQQTAVRLDSENADSHYELMHAFIARENTAAASQELDEFTRLAPNTAANREKIDDAKKRIDQLRAAGK